MIEWVFENLEIIIASIFAILGVAKFISNITPTAKDDKIVAKVAGVIDKFIDLFIPNLKKGGGTHNKHLVELVGDLKKAIDKKKSKKK